MPIQDPRTSVEELFKIAANTRQLEIQLFWQRANYFLVLNTTIAVGFFARRDPVTWQSIVLAGFGLLVSILWFLVNLGSRYWHVRWEVATQRIEREYSREARMFAATPTEARAEVLQGLDRTGQKTWLPGYARYISWIDALVLQKPSVGQAMINLPLIFAAFWLILLVGSLVCQPNSMDDERTKPIEKVPTASETHVNSRVIDPGGLHRPMNAQELKSDVATEP